MSKLVISKEFIKSIRTAQSTIDRNTYRSDKFIARLSQRYEDKLAADWTVNNGVANYDSAVRSLY